jgi:hypothetical protein
MVHAGGISLGSEAVLDVVIPSLRSVGLWSRRLSRDERGAGRTSKRCEREPRRLSSGAVLSNAESWRIGPRRPQCYFAFQWPPRVGPLRKRLPVMNRQGQDVLIHAGDFMAFGDAPKEIIDFNQWLGKQPHRFKVVMAGNHDFMFERPPGAAKELLANAICLENSGTELADWRSGDRLFSPKSIIVISTSVEGDEPPMRLCGIDIDPYTLRPVAIWEPICWNSQVAGITVR